MLVEGLRNLTSRNLDVVMTDTRNKMAANSRTSSRTRKGGEAKERDSSVSDAPKDANCGKCDKLITSSCKSLKCEMCRGWFCVPTCSHDVVEDMYDSLIKFPSASFHWFCERCNGNAVDTLNLINSMKQKQHEFERRIDVVEAAMANLSTEVKQEVKQSVHDKVREALESERRRCNVIISGLPEEADTSDENIVNELIKEALQLTVGIKEMQRLGEKKSDRIRPLKLILKDRDDWRKILQSTKRLKLYEREVASLTIKPYEKVYIDADKTRAQQEKAKAMRQRMRDLNGEGDRNFRIRNGRLVRLDKAGQVEAVVEIDM
jgi:hypothetical protein